MVVTRLEVLKPIEPGTSSVVLAVSMKTPHRSLRSNEIELQSNGLLDIPLELTFSLQVFFILSLCSSHGLFYITLQYPHFLKRGGNTLQIKIQRRKRYRQRAIGGYKTLVAGNINMAQVLQHSFQGVVKLFSEKATEHVALVTVRSLTSVAMDIDSRLNMGLCWLVLAVLADNILVISTYAHMHLQAPVMRKMMRYSQMISWKTLTVGKLSRSVHFVT